MMLFEGQNARHASESGATTKARPPRLAPPEILWLITRRASMQVRMAKRRAAGYGYLNRVRSSRRLEAEANRNIELIWLVGGLNPDFKTISVFSSVNRAHPK